MRKRSKARSARSDSKPKLRPVLRRLSPSSTQYKVVELSTVDEGTVEHTVNEWVGRGWTLESVQFAMRESSRRPAMAFVFFTRHGGDVETHRAGVRERLAPGGELPRVSTGSIRSVELARERLRQLADEPPREPGDREI